MVEGHYLASGFMVEILDSTLREGEQTAGVSFNSDERIKIATALSKFGVDIIEVGNPGVSEDIKNSIKEVSNLGLKTPLLCHSLATKENIDLVAQMNTEWIGLFWGTSDISLKYKFNMPRAKALEKITEVIEYASNYGLKIRFTAEDASRTDINFLTKVYNTAKAAGATRGSIADTVGNLTPRKTSELVSGLVKSTKLPLHIHCHNDLGLATANAIAAYEAGITLIDVTVNGLGERAGITTLDELAVSLKKIYNVKNGWKIEMLPELSAMVERYSGIFNANHKPIVGKNVFSHKAGVHTSAVLKNPLTYEFLRPEEFGRERAILVDKFAGTAAVKHFTSKLGHKANDAQIKEIISQIKNRNRKFCTEFDVIKIIENVLGISRENTRNAQALVFVTANHDGYINDLKNGFAKHPEITNCLEIAGEYDLCLHAKTDSVRKLNLLVDKIRSMENVQKTNTMVILNG